MSVVLRLPHPGLKRLIMSDICHVALTQEAMTPDFWCLSKRLKPLSRKIRLESLLYAVSCFSVSSWSGSTLQ